MATSRSSSCAREEKKKSSAPHGAELTSPEGGSRACRTPECAKLCSRRWQLRLCRMWRGALPRLCREWKEEERPTSAGSADPEKVGLTRRGPPTCRHRREWLRHGECAKGRVQPPGEPVKVGRTVETKRDVPTFLGLRVLTSFACALGDSALPFMGSPRTAGQPHLFHQQPTTDLFPSKIKIQQSSIDNSSSTTPMATARRGAEAQSYRVWRGALPA